jgi:NADH:quinone reductase (non-electrogenic)
MSERSLRSPGAACDRTWVMDRLVVVGGGFGGLQTVLKLRRAPVEVTLVDRRNFHLFQPLTYQVATGALSPAEIAYPLRSIFKRNRNVRVLLAEVADFDLDARELQLREVDGVPVPSAISYDTLVVAGGSHYSFFGHDAWAEHATEVKSLESALVARSKILSAFEAAEMEPDPELQQAWLTFVVVGAGPTGVEMAGQIAELARDTLRRDFRSVDPRGGRILLLEMADRALTTFPPSLSMKAERSLQRLGVSVLTGRTVVGIDANGVSVTDSASTPEQIPSRTVIWAAGVTASGLASHLSRLCGAETDHAGRVTVEPDLTLPGHPEVFAIGDMVRVRSADGDSVLLPGVAPVAMQQGRYVAKVVRARLDGRPTTPFSVPRQGESGDDWSRGSRGRHKRSPAERLRRVERVAARAPLVPHRLSEPAPRPAPLGLQLRDTRARGTADHAPLLGVARRPRR